MKPRRANGVLREITLLFLRLGLTAFGGPAAHIAMMRREVVERRQWVTDEEFLDLVGATNLIPGPNSTELAIHLGHRRGGAVGLLVAGASFILPAAFLTLGVAWLYVRFGKLPEASAAFYGIKPVIVAVIAQAVWGLGRTAIKNTALGLVALAGVLATVAGINELVILFASALVYAIWSARPSQHEIRSPSRAFLLGGAPPLGAAAVTAVTSKGVFLAFLKIGSVLFGSGYVLLAFLRADLVQGRHWLTEDQLLDAVAVGQMTPGPVFTTATFLGYLLDGNEGALAATVGIFLPAFVFVAVSGPLIPRLRRSPTAARFLDGLNVASLALMATVGFRLAHAAVTDVWTAGLALASTFLLVRHRVNAAWLVFGGSAVGGVVQLLR